MKNQISKIVGVSLLGLSIAAIPVNLPASAQTSSGTATTETSSTGTGTNTTTVERTENHGGYWGLLGLLGLFGLIGRGNKAATVAYRDPEEVRGRSNTGI